MIPSYEDRKESLYMVHRVSKHVSPHLHNSAEFVYVTEGTLELGVGQELYHMEKGDLGIVFPDVIHHYQVLSPQSSKAYYLMASPALCGQFSDDIKKYCPENPVIKKEQVHPDICRVLRLLISELNSKEQNPAVEQAYIQIIMARSMPCFKMIEKCSIGSNDIIYQTVSYVAKHFREELSLEIVAKDLGVSKYVLSRVFSGTFHSNFKQYINEQRLNYVSTLLECTDQTITEICMDAGFESQRTFNRVFQEKYKMTPREYRKLCKNRYLMQE
ncbi:MAG: AraC family transcriptional regulator [Eubacteriales bacterium]|nr:AraC family transcriptional regulator [Eubacteriales bacterium]